MLKQIFTDLVSKFTSEPEIIRQLWAEIETNYSLPERHYHTLSHLENLYHQLDAFRQLIKDRDTLLFSLFYHDLIYDAARQDNEAASAALAQQRMELIGVPAEMIRKCGEQILATKAHAESTDTDTNLFTDADLCILGQDRQAYLSYAAGVRQEYIIYPDTLYNAGRIRVLEHFLAMDSIFKTKAFSQKFEQQARLNITLEISVLSNGAGIK